MSSQPNVLLINCDDLGYGDLACYGSELHKTPAIDRLATEGLKLNDFYMASPVSSPSRGAMMTGCYPPRIGFGTFEGRGVLFPGQPVGMSSDETTVASILKGQGYATRIIGKWHCGDQPTFLPTRHGFDGYFGIPYSNDMGRQRRRNNKSGISEWPPLPLVRDEQVIQAQPDQTTITERYTEDAVRFIRENQDRPWFLYFAHMHVHLPHYVPQHFLDKSFNGPYGAAVEYIDWSVSVLLRELEDLGLDENTLIIFTSDNGSNTRFGGSNHPLRGRKGTTWEGGMRVPCLMRWPKIIPAGSVSNELSSAIDILPTLAEVVGGSMPVDRIIDGKSILPIMRGDDGATTPHEAFFYYMMLRLEAVRSGKWKLHVAKTGDPVQMLYDLENDIGERHNVYDEHPDVVADLMAKVEACRKDLGDSITGVEGENCRPIGHVENAKPMTEYDESHPYIIALYDLPHAG